MLALGLNLAFLAAGSLFSMIVAVVDPAHLAERALLLFSSCSPPGSRSGPGIYPSWLCMYYCWLL